MFELIQAAGNTYYINSPAKIGLYRITEKDVCLIDTGNDKDAGRKIKKILEEKGWNLSLIINTHSNADHIGGNKFLQDRYQCPVLTAGVEGAFTQYPLLEPSFLYGGCPPSVLRHKFLMAQPSRCTEISSVSLPGGLEYFPLGGHFFDMIGIKTPDDVYFLADCLVGENIIDKYHISFLYDVRAYLDTLNKVEGLKGRLFIPAHMEATEDIRPAVLKNRGKIEEIIGRLLKICANPLSFEDILKEIFDYYGLAMDFDQYVLVGSTIKSYLSYLSDEGKITADFRENKLYWHTTSL